MWRTPGSEQEGAEDAGVWWRLVKFRSEQRGEILFVGSDRRVLADRFLAKETLPPLRARIVFTAFRRLRKKRCAYDYLLPHGAGWLSGFM